MSNHTHTYARFWKCALQVNTVGYSETYRGSSHGMSESDYNTAWREVRVEDLPKRLTG